MIPFSMKHLRYFDALARLGHFGRAAEECAISQPALSVQIKEMEDLVGAPLVERTPRQIRLTALGEAFATQVHEILRSVDALEDLVRAARAPFMGQLRLGAIPTVAPYLLPALVAELAQTYPGLDLRPREAITQKLLEDIMDGLLDAAIVALPVSEASLHELPLFEEEFVLVRPPADAGKPVPAADKLWQMRLLLLEEGHCFREQALAFCKLSAAEAPHNMMEGSSLSTLVQMVGAGIGITLVPEMALGVETRSARIALSRLASPRPSRTIGMIWRRSHPLAGELQAVGGIVRRIGENMRMNTARLLQQGGF